MTLGHDGAEHPAALPRNQHAVFGKEAPCHL